MFGLHSDSIAMLITPSPITCCRHGESVANAGAKSSNPLAIELTPFGVSQAELLSLSWVKEPSAIISSPAARALATAMPTRQRFERSPFEVWPIHEFTYLCPERCKETTTAQRRGWVLEYWARADPDWLDGPGAETFSQFMERAQNSLARLARLQSQKGGWIVLFGHGQFINAMRWLQQGAAHPWNMWEYRNFDEENFVKHCAPIDLEPVHDSQ